MQPPLAQLILRSDDIAQCAAFGTRVVAGYRDGKKPRSKLLVVEGREPIHDNVQIQTEGRLAELALTRWLGLADTVLDWSDACDDSYDLKIGQLTIDVKSTSNPKGTSLI